MQTFLPYASFEETAKALDLARLTFVMRDSLTLMKSLARFYPLNKRGESGFEGHTVGQFWKGHEISLAKYGLALAQNHLYRPANASKAMTLTQRKLHMSMWQQMIEALEDRGFPEDPPPLIGDEEFHSAFRAFLLYRDIQAETFKLWKKGKYPNHVVTRDLLPKKSSWKRQHYVDIWEYFDRPEPKWYAQFGWTEEPDDMRVFYSEDRVPQMLKEKQRKIDRPFASFLVKKKDV
jgi:hypothetical protein